ncbi:MAG TPA: hypothetical protein VN900_09505 [Stellaceae bacterium]|jgi:hypothetical protein|nr:hypothetical protein [Stellaceae bacterium]
MLGRASFIAVALVSAAVGAHSLNLRELYGEMYPAEPVKHDAFQICDDADPTFVRAVGADREACYNSMPHIMAVAMGRVRAGGALTMQALTDPSREAELLMTLAAMPPRQPITTRRSFSNTAWVRALSPPCDDKRALPTVSYTGSAGLPPAAGTGRAAALDSAIRNNLPLPRATQPGIARRDPLPVIALAPAQPAPATQSATDPGDKVTAFNPLPAPDIGDDGPPAIVPLAPASTCGGA